MRAQVYTRTRSLADDTWDWPSWLVFDEGEPWYITLSWQSQEDTINLDATYKNTTVWYLGEGADYNAPLR
jgi:hypothetical protein